jgi:hypothetical protein
VTVNGVSDEALVAGPTTQAAAGNEGGLDVGAPRIEITDDAQPKHSTPDVGAVASEKRPDDLPPAAKPGKLEVKFSCLASGNSAILCYRDILATFKYGTVFDIACCTRVQLRLVESTS